MPRRAPPGGKAGTPVAALLLRPRSLQADHDRFGHEVGDAVLRGAGGRLERTFRPGDTVARVGGDEFAVLAEGVDNGDELVLRAREEVERPLVLEIGESRRRLAVGISGGWAAAQAGESVRRVMHRADREMYEDKRIRTDRCSGRQQSAD